MSGFEESDEADEADEAKESRAALDRVLANASIVPTLAPSTKRRPIPDGIVGATILGFGTVAWDEFYDHGPIETGGLVIDYAPSDGSPARRVAFGFSELGMWISYFGAAGN